MQPYRIDKSRQKSRRKGLPGPMQGPVTRTVPQGPYDLLRFKTSNNIYSKQRRFAQTPALLRSSVVLPIVSLPMFFGHGLSKSNMTLFDIPPRGADARDAPMRKNRRSYREQERPRHEQTDPPNTTFSYVIRNSSAPGSLSAFLERAGPCLAPCSCSPSSCRTALHTPL